jgi:hypothetical protein
MHSDAEQELELTYTIKVRTFGKPSKMVQDVGKRLARSSALALGKTTVIHEDQTFTWSPQDHSG